MANPQKEAGHIDIANEIGDHFCGLCLESNDWKVLWVVLRKTYGWRKKTDRISITQFQKMTRIDRHGVTRSLKRLVARSLLAVASTPLGNEYSFNKDWEKWDSDGPHLRSRVVATRGKHRTTDGGFLATTSSGVYSTHNKQLTNNTTTKERERETPAQVMHSFLNDPDARSRTLGYLIRKGYPKNIADVELSKFSDYWTELTKDGKRQRWQLESTFELTKRLATWFSRVSAISVDPDRVNKRAKLLAFKEEHGYFPAGADTSVLLD